MSNEKKITRTINPRTEAATPVLAVLVALLALAVAGCATEQPEVGRSESALTKEECEADPSIEGCYELLLELWPDPDRPPAEAPPVGDFWILSCAACTDSYGNLECAGCCLKIGWVGSDTRLVYCQEMAGADEHCAGSDGVFSTQEEESHASCEFETWTW